MFRIADHSQYHQVGHHHHYHHHHYRHNHHHHHYHHHYHYHHHHDATWSAGDEDVWDERIPLYVVHRSVVRLSRYLDEYWVVQIIIIIIVIIVIIVVIVIIITMLYFPPIFLGGLRFIKTFLTYVSFASGLFPFGWGFLISICNKYDLVFNLLSH